jgi:hypothetical protein
VFLSNIKKEPPFPWSGKVILYVYETALRRTAIYCLFVYSRLGNSSVFRRVSPLLVTGLQIDLLLMALAARVFFFVPTPTATLDLGLYGFIRRSVEIKFCKDISFHFSTSQLNTKVTPPHPRHTQRVNTHPPLNPQRIAFEKFL